MEILNKFEDLMNMTSTLLEEKKALLDENLKLLREKNTLRDTNEKLTFEKNIMINQMKEVHRELQNIRIEVSKLRSGKASVLTQEDLKVIRFLVHPDRSKRDSADLFCKVNSLIEK